MSISLRISDKERKIIQDFAELYGVSVSEFIRTAVMERIEDEFDLKSFEKAKKEFEENPTIYTHEEVGKMLGLE